jgi:hypothetical protein
MTDTVPLPARPAAPDPGCGPAALPGARVAAGYVVTLRTNTVPVLHAGRYHLSATQEVSCATGPPLSQQREVEVDAPRFGLDPQTVFACYPPDGGSGDYSTTLPHLTLTSPTLPWDRVLDPQHAGALPAPGPRVPTAGGVEVPWVALLVLTDQDVRPDPHTQDMITQWPVNQAFTTSDPTIGLPHLTDEVARITDQCRTVDVSLTAVRALLPRREELGYLTHVREVTDAQKAWDDRWERGSYSVVLANRFAHVAQHAPARRFTAVLVSLEGHGGRDYLGGSTPVDPRVVAVRFAVLWSWSFTCHQDGVGTFTEIVTEMVGASQPDPMLRLPHPLTTASRPPAEDATPLRPAPGDVDRDIAADTQRGQDGVVGQWLRLGYVPVAHRLPDGATSVAWYRGPYVPVVPAPVPDTAWSVAGSLIWLPSHGMLDLSYAAAFEIGRVLALSSGPLAQAVARARADALRVARHAVATHLRASEEDLDARGRFQALLTGGFGATVTTNLANNLTNTPDSIAAHPSGADASPSAPTAAVTGRVGPCVAAAVHALTHPTPAPGVPDTSGSAAEVDEELVRVCAAAIGERIDEHRSRVHMAGFDALDLLDHVPFHHLVPDPLLLSDNSIRFFYLDSQWMSALVAGAGSVGASTPLDQYVIDQLIIPLPDRVQWCGLVIRSPLVRHWPELVIDPRRTPPPPSASRGRDREEEPGEPVAQRRRQLAADVLVVLFERVPDVVAVREPSFALHFGLDTRLDEPDGGSLALRQPDGTGVGTPTTTTLGRVIDHLRPTPTIPERRVLALLTLDADGTGASGGEQDSASPGGVSGLVPALADALKVHPEVITPAVLALELLDTRHEVVFTRQGRGMDHE